MVIDEGNRICRRWMSISDQDERRVTYQISFPSRRMPFAEVGYVEITRICFLHEHTDDIDQTTPVSIFPMLDIILVWYTDIGK